MTISSRTTIALGALACLGLAGPAAAAAFDFSSLTPSYWTLPPGQAGAQYVNGVEPGWTVTATANQLTLLKDSSPELSGGPHVHTYLQDQGTFVATVTAQAGGGASVGNVFLQTPGGYAGFGFGSGWLASSYNLAGVPNQQFFVNVQGPFTFELARYGDVFTASYSTGGAFTPLYSITSPSVLGNPTIDLTPYAAVGSTATQSLTYTNLDIALPEPAAWATMLLGLAGLGGALRARRKAAAAV